MIKVCHVTSAHPKNDIRIFRKECLSLVSAGYDVSLVQQGGDGECEGVHIKGFGDISDNPVRRIFGASKAAYKAASQIDAQVYHLHDPELLRYALKLKKKGSCVIFDSHEDVPADILEKPWIPKLLRPLISSIYAKYEKHIISRIDAAISVTPHICKRLSGINPNTEMVTNFPIPEENLPEPDFTGRTVVFPGLISNIWCIENIIEAIRPLDSVTLELRSAHKEHPYYDSLIRTDGWDRVNYPGGVPRPEVLKVIANASCGMALLRYYPNSDWHNGTLGNTKIFEYMMVGIPVICTDFVLWKQIIDEYECGICVNPDDIDAIRRAISFFIDNPAEARRMGNNGKRAVLQRYNWSTQEKRLLELYTRILQR